VAAALTKTISASPPTKKSSSTSAAELYSARHSFVPEAKVKTFKDQSGRVVGVEDPFFRRSIAAPKTEYFDEKDLKKYERLNTAARIMSRSGSGIRKKKEVAKQGCLVGLAELTQHRNKDSLAERGIFQKSIVNKNGSNHLWVLGNGGENKQPKCLLYTHSVMLKDLVGGLLGCSDLAHTQGRLKELQLRSLANTFLRSELNLGQRQK